MLCIHDNEQKVSSLEYFNKANVYYSRPFPREGFIPSSPYTEYKNTYIIGSRGTTTEMPTKELPDSAPGKYVPYHPNPYYSPEALPIEPKLEISDQTHDFVADAAYQMGRVDGISSTVDFSAVLFTSLIRIEAVESARIEGADVVYQDLEVGSHDERPGQRDQQRWAQFSGTSEHTGGSACRYKYVIDRLNRPST